MTSNANERSTTVRAIGPQTPIPLVKSVARAGERGGAWPRCGTRLDVGLWVNTPHKCAGTRSDALRSDPSSSGTYPAASAAADPPDEPPGERLRYQGLFVVP